MLLDMILLASWMEWIWRRFHFENDEGKKDYDISLDEAINGRIRLYGEYPAIFMETSYLRRNAPQAEAVMSHK